uniref:Uncharacterized protein n=1 Tax=Pithovirus LCPAC401 TaxID=2506595 RepID=A0A481ZCU9_9VIRU|nr:MAG: hypothetical protein LCPAC401_01290 [Pithovirus LCPAC401]
METDKVIWEIMEHDREEIATEHEGEWHNVVVVTGSDFRTTVR